MTNERFGPWSSALGDDLSPRLSTFWTRRLERLSSARSARAGLSRRDWLKLGAAGAAACALPSLHLATADGPVAADGQEPANRIYARAEFRAGPGPGDWDAGIFAIDPATGAREKVSDFDAFALRASRDGRTLALARSGKTGPEGREIENPGVWTLDAGGRGEPRRVADFGGTLSWSPDGRALIVAKWLSKPGDDESRSENWRIPLDASDPVKLPVPETEEVDDWSPDGRWFVSVSDRHEPHGSGYQLYVMHPDGTEERRLTEGRGLNVYPRFSPDSRRVAYIHQERGETSLWVVDVDGGGRRQLVREEDDTFPGHLCWSPDGRTLAYTTSRWSRDEAGKRFIGDPEKADPRIAMIDLDGENRRILELPPARWIDAPDWR